MAAKYNLVLQVTIQMQDFVEKDLNNVKCFIVGTINFTGSLILSHLNTDAKYTGNNTNVR
jgi:hypothetical protein